MSRLTKFILVAAFPVAALAFAYSSYFVVEDRPPVRSVAAVDTDKTIPAEIKPAEIEPEEIAPKQTKPALPQSLPEDVKPTPKPKPRITLPAPVAVEPPPVETFVETQPEEIPAPEPAAVESEPEPIPAVEPTPAEAEPEIEEERPVALPASRLLTEEVKESSRSRIRAGAVGSFFAFIGQDKTNGRQATLASSISPGIQLGWEQVWSERWNTYLQYEGQRVSITPSTSRVILGNEQWLSELEFGVRWAIQPGLGFGLTVSQGETLLHRATSLTTIQMEKSQKTKVKARVEGNLINLAPLSLALGAEGGLVLPGTSNEFQTTTGSTYGADIKLVHRSQSGRGLEAQVFHQNSRIETGTVKFTEKESGIKFSLSWEWGEN